MEKLLSQNELEKLYNKEKKEIGVSGINEILKEKRSTEATTKKRKSIFLSHSHLDKMIIPRIALLFDKVDCDIYIDWMDADMPKVTDKFTASTIKDKILNCNKFLFLATFRGLQSKWCDWELGVAYSLKKDIEIAVLPIQTKTGKWTGSEYLDLYAEMEFDESDYEKMDSSKVKIKFTNDKIISLEEWLSD